MLLACASALGQASDTGVSGRIQLPAGAAGSIPVMMNPVSQGNGVSYRATTNNEGSFRFENVRPGEYTVFAGAAMAPLFPGADNGAQAIVLGPQTLVVARRSGTFYPGTADASAARAITVSLGSRFADVDFPLAAGALNWAGPQFQSVSVRFIVEGGGAPTFNSDRLGLAFSDGPANVAFEVTFQDGLQKPAAQSIRIERTQEPFLMKSLVPMPAFPADEFRLVLPEGIIRVGQVTPVKAAPTPTSSHVVTPAKNFYYIKSMTFGATDLMKGLMTLRGPVNDPLVITLARCTDRTTHELLCN